MTYLVFDQGQEFHHPTGTLGLSVTIFTVCAILLIIMLVARRQFPIFGKAELGGPKTFKHLTGMIALVMWVLYVIVSSLQAQGYIEAF
ncbi:unnamed protein product [Lymnaea stagnalis]|uniref:Uncharacterized protein n=1 Tax=Lymnaea stagnalis TaxID=6523 RepID=A0AAV2IHX0_LYMST